MTTEKTSCTSISSVETAYSEDDRIVPVQGVMYEVVNMQDVPMQILTLEVDVRALTTEEEEATATVTDLTIEVYALRGQFEFLVEEEPAWTLHAVAQGIPAPDGPGLIIPKEFFIPIEMQPKERWSFYVSMNGPYIEYNANALIKSEELFLNTPDLAIYAGIGTDAKFRKPTSTTTQSVYPQFAGVFHFQSVVDCRTLVTETQVPFAFLVSASTATAALLAQVSDAVDDVVDTEILTLPLWQNFVTQYAFQRGPLGPSISEPADFSGDCPSGWEACTVVTSSLRFIHLDALDSGRVLLEMYRYDIASSIQDRLEGIIDHTLSIGYRSIQADFDFRLTGVPEGGVVMNDVQQSYFQDTTVTFFQDNLSARSDVLRVYQVQVQSQDSPTRRLRDRRLNNGSIRVKGTVMGARTGSHTDDDWATMLEDAIVVDEQDYVTRLNTVFLRPLSVDDASLSDFFGEVTQVSGTVEPAGDVSGNLNASSSSDGSSSMPAIVGAIAAVGAILLFGGIFWTWRKRKFNVEYQDEVKAVREQRRHESMLRKAEPTVEEAPSIEQPEVNPRKGALSIDDMYEMGYTEFQKKANESGVDIPSPDELGQRNNEGDASNNNTQVQKEAPKDLQFRLSNSLSDLDSMRHEEKSASDDMHSAGGKTLLSLFMEKQADKQAKSGHHMSGTRSCDGLETDPSNHAQIRRPRPRRVPRPKRQAADNMTAKNAPDSPTRSYSEDGLPQFSPERQRRPPQRPLDRDRVAPNSTNYKLIDPKVSDLSQEQDAGRRAEDAPKTPRPPRPPRRYKSSNEDDSAPPPTRTPRRHKSADFVSNSSNKSETDKLPAPPPRPPRRHKSSDDIAPASRPGARRPQRDVSSSNDLRVRSRSRDRSSPSLAQTPQPIKQRVGRFLDDGQPEPPSATSGKRSEPDARGVPQNSWSIFGVGNDSLKTGDRSGAKHSPWANVFSGGSNGDDWLHAHMQGNTQTITRSKDTKSEDNAEKTKKKNDGRKRIKRSNSDDNIFGSKRNMTHLSHTKSKGVAGSNAIAKYSPAKQTPRAKVKADKKEKHHGSKDRKENTRTRTEARRGLSRTNSDDDIFGSRRNIKGLINIRSTGDTAMI